MHSHVVQTTRRELEGTLDDWASRPTDEVQVIYVGGRDALVIVRHEGHRPGESHGAHQATNPLHRPDRDVHIGSIVIGDRAGGGHDGNRLHGLIVGSYDDSRAVGPDGTAELLPYGGWVEDEHATWILYLDRDKRPVAYYPRRDDTGAVIGPVTDLTGARDELRAGMIPAADLRLEDLVLVPGLVEDFEARITGINNSAIAEFGSLRFELDSGSYMMRAPEELVELVHRPGEPAVPTLG